MATEFLNLRLPRYLLFTPDKEVKLVNSGELTTLFACGKLAAVITKKAGNLKLPAFFYSVIVIIYKAKESGVAVAPA